MSFKQLNPGLWSSHRGCSVTAFSFRLTGAGTNPTNLRQGGANAVASVIYNGATGRFKVTLNKTWPRQVIACMVSTAQAGAGVDTLIARYVRDSYSTADGTFLIDVLDTGTEAAAPALSNGAASDEVMVILVAQDRDALVEA